MKGLRMRGHVLSVHNGDKDRGIRRAARVAAIASHNSGNPRTLLFRILHRGHQIRAYLLFQVAPTDREDQQSIGRPQPADAQPTFKNACPSLIVGARG
jgi:hypothetical protein